MHCSFLETVAFYSVLLEPFLIMSVYIYSIMSKSSLQGLLRQTVELLFSHPITLSSSYLGASWSGSYSLILLPHRSCSAPLHLLPSDPTPPNPLQPRIHIYRQHFRCSFITPLDEKNTHVTQSSRPDCQVCANGRAQAIARQDQWSQQDAQKIALRYVITTSTLSSID